MTAKDNDPHRGHSRSELYRRLAKVDLRAPAPRSSAAHSNLGAGLLGHLLEEATDLGQEAQAAEEVRERHAERVDVSELRARLLARQRG